METCNGDYEVDSSKQLDSIKECAERCDDFEKCRFFYYNTKQWCGMYEACDTTREASYPGSTYEKRSLSGLELRFYSIQVTFLLTEYNEPGHNFIHNLMYSFISENYVLKPANQICASNLIIENLEECKLAGSLKNLAFNTEPSGSNEDHPKGCFYAYGQVFWNTHTSGNPNPISQPICKAGEWFELIPTN